MYSYQLVVATSAERRCHSPESQAGASAHDHSKSKEEGQGVKRNFAVKAEHMWQLWKLSLAVRVAALVLHLFLSLDQGHLMYPTYT